MRRARALTELDTLAEDENVASTPTFRPPNRRNTSGGKSFFNSSSAAAEGWDEDKSTKKLQILMPPNPLARLPDSYGNIEASGQKKRAMARGEEKLMDLLVRNTKMVRHVRYVCRVYDTTYVLY